MKTRVLAAITFVNVLVSVFVTYAYLAFTSRMAIETDVGGNNVIYTQDGGGEQGLVRCGILAFVALLLHGILAIFNFSSCPTSKPTTPVPPASASLSPSAASR